MAYNKFGRLIKIDGSTNSKWSDYTSAKSTGNIVFADLTATDTTGIPSGDYARGYYIWANGVEYKVANLIDFNNLKSEYETFKSDANASIADLSTDRNELERWRNALNFKLENNKITIVDGTSDGIKGEINLAGTGYVGVTTNASTMTISILDGSVQKGSGSGYVNDVKLATDGYVKENVAALNSSINSSLDNINASIIEVSTRLDNASTRLKDMIETIELSSANQDYVTTVSLKTTKEDGATATQSFNVKGDDYVNVVSGSDASIKLKIEVINTSLDGITASNTSLAGAGAIVSYVNRKVSNLTGALRLMGDVSTAAELDDILSGNKAGVDASKGCMWIATASFKYPTTINPSVSIESGDQIVITKDADKTTSPVTKAEFIVVERNLDGAVTASDRRFKANQVIVGYEDEKQTVKDSGYTLGDDTSTNYGDNDKKLSTEKGAKAYTDGKIAGQTLVANISTASGKYFDINASMYESGKFRIESGVNVVTYDDANAAATTATAGNSIADADSFKKAIQDVKGTLVVATGTADASALIALQMSGGDTSIGVKGGEYIQVSQDPSNLTLAVKNTILANATTAADGLAIASDVSAKFIEDEAANATFHNALKTAIGLTDAVKANWNASIAAEYNADADTPVITVIEAIDASLTKEANRLDASIIAMKVTNTDHQDSIMVGITQEDGKVGVVNASLKINGVGFTHTVNDGVVTATITGNEITVGGDTEWADSSINKAIVDLSTMIENVSTSFLKKVNGETELTAVTGTTISGDFVAVSTTAPANNQQTLDSSILLAVHPNVSTGSYTPATDKGLATDGYVQDYVTSILEWEEI